MVDRAAGGGAQAFWRAALGPPVGWSAAGAAGGLLLEPGECVALAGGCGADGRNAAVAGVVVVVVVVEDAAVMEFDLLVASDERNWRVKDHAPGGQS